MNVTQKLISAHLLEGEMTPGSEITLRIDQTLTQDSTGTMAYLQLEAMGIQRVKTEKSVAYVDHNTLQTGFENADDHKYLQTIAQKYGIYFSRPGNGICHQVHLERFSQPGKTLLGSDSHTPTCGAAGMLAIGAGGLDVAAAMGGSGYRLAMPKICGVLLTGKLSPWVSAKDVILTLLGRLGVKGGVGKVLEYFGEGVKTLRLPQRATIANMGAELGATTSVFPSDLNTLAFFKAQGRTDDWIPLEREENSNYDEIIELDLSEIVPLAACPHSPDHVKPVSELKKIRVDQVAIGSCTNSSYEDLMLAAKILKGKTIHPEVSLVVAPGSKQVLTLLARNGALADLIAAGARILECGCGPCIGMGQSPATDAVSLRTFNRNFKGRSGTESAQVYLAGPETAAASALSGFIEDPRGLGEFPNIAAPANFYPDDNLILPPENPENDVKVKRGPNIKAFPLGKALPRQLAGKALIKLEDNITTDHIMPSNAKLLPFRSNIEYLAEYCLTPCDKDFPKRAKNNPGGFILSGENYGQGSSREHAALAPLQLGVCAVIAKSFARIHKANLVNNGILPLVFSDPAEYAHTETGDELLLDTTALFNEKNSTPIFLTIQNKTKNRSFTVTLDVSDRQKALLLHGGYIPYLNAAQKGSGQDA